LKLVSACEKLKRNLSANSNEIPLNVESLISEDKDFSARIERATFEELSGDLFKKAEDCFRRTLERAKENFDKILITIREEAKAARAAKAAKKAKAAEAAKAAKAAKEAEAAAAAAAAATTEGDKAPDTPMDADSASVSGESQEPPKQNDAESKPEDKSDEKADVKMETESTQENGAPSEANGTEAAMEAEPEINIAFELQAVEMVGGSTRVPAIKRIIQEVFNMTPSTTLNTDEAVARGCVLHCATLHPGTKVKRYVKVLGVEPFATRTNCDKNLRRVELELIQHDRKHISRTEARNNLEEYIYSERSSLEDGDSFKSKLSEALDWLFSDEGEDASEDEYSTKLAELRSLKDAKLAAERQTETTENAEKKKE
jgi:hypothetical protein